MVNEARLKNLAEAKARQMARAKERRERALELYKLDWDVDTIASELGVGRDSVTRYLRGIRPGLNRTPFSEEEKAAALSMLEDRAGYAQVARTLGRHEKLIARMFPGYALTLEESIERAVMGKKFNQIGVKL